MRDDPFMLTCYGHNVRLPRNDLAYLAFRLAIRETFCVTELYSNLEEESDPPVGYLAEMLAMELMPLLARLESQGLLGGFHE